MDREAGIAAYAATIPAAEHRKRRAAGHPPEHDDRPVQGDTPVISVVINKATPISDKITKYAFTVVVAACANGFPEEARHLEYFAVPEQPAYTNHPFTLALKDGREIAVSKDQSAVDALLAAGIHVDVKCADGVCGVCKCDRLEGKVAHRDFVLSKAQRSHAMILCQSRADSAGAVLRIDL